MREVLAPKFWSYFSETTPEVSYFYEFQTAVEGLYNDLLSYVPLLNKLEKLRSDCNVNSAFYGETNIVNAFKLLARATLLSQLPPCHSKTIESFYEDAFRAFCNLDEDTNDEEGHCIGCLQEAQNCHCQKICNIFYDTNRYISIRYLLSRINILLLLQEIS